MNKTAIKILMGLILASVSLTANAEGLEKKTSKINFNAMIDNSGQQRQNLHSELEDFYDKGQLPETKDARKVVDFVDVELHWGGQQKSVVDRRFDSIGEPIFDSATNTSMNLKMIETK